MDHALDQAFLDPIHCFLNPFISMAAAALLQPSCSMLSPAAPGADRRHTGCTALPPATAPRLAPPAPPRPDLMNSPGLTLGTVLLAVSGLFCLATLFFGTKGGYYDTDAYDGNGTAH
ncbi:MAG: hypothetical protein RLZZ206_3077 [Cyanobacteriota bacterium]